MKAGKKYFNSFEAFSRNIGLTDPSEQADLSQKTIAIPGMGGVGGIHLLNSVRLGVQNFKIADFDDFELHNFNRQVGANIDTIGKNKSTAMKNMALKINPNCKIKSYTEGINDENINDFLDGVDLLIDGLDIFAMTIRRKIINLALEKGIPVITAGPIGMGTSFITFLPEGPNFDENFNVNNNTEADEILLRFLIGLSPNLLHTKYLLQEHIDLSRKKVPSIGSATLLAAGVTGIETLKVLLDRGHILPAPYSHQFDVYSHRYKIKKIGGFFQSFLFEIKVRLATYKFKSLLLKPNMSLNQEKSPS